MHDLHSWQLIWRCCRRRSQLRFAPRLNVLFLVVCCRYLLNTFFAKKEISSFLLKATTKKKKRRREKENDMEAREGWNYQYSTTHKLSPISNVTSKGKAREYQQSHGSPNSTMISYHHHHYDRMKPFWTSTKKEADQKRKREEHGTARNCQKVLYE